ncbi:MAG TPA: sodium-coupled permease [Cytophagales bacterium]|nr:sodium-coupled permease [Cytophagales bacterium]HAA19848.1 sodium-coupled permease [Cytophagales bacterium]
MHWIDWLILGAFFAFTIWDGIRQNKKTQSVEDLLLANRSMPWWAVGLSVMATQASAISFVGTTGQAYTEDMRFIHMYLAVPFAMLILAFTLLPFYNRLKIFTVYESLEKKFGLRVRLLTSFLFLLSRGLSMGLIIAAPAYVLSLILQVPLSTTILVIGLGATVYTVFGGISGVIRTDIKQMVLMMAGLAFVFGWIWHKLPSEVGLSGALHLAGALDKLNTLEFAFDPSDKYNVWSGVLGGLFLMLAYFGTDQSQAQRYLTSKSLRDAQGSLMMSALAKVPMMFVMLLLGALMYVFYVFQPPPMVFIPDCEEPPAAVTDSFTQAHTQRSLAAENYLNHPDAETRQQLVMADAQVRQLRHEEIQRVEMVSGEERNDTNYILPFFVLTQMPIGIIGIIVAAILAAALSSIDSGLNSLASSTVIDWYQRLSPGKKSDKFYLRSTQLTTVGWGLFAIATALLFGETESIVELVNKIGSYFYGAILGVFILLWVKPAKGIGAFIGLFLGMGTVFLFDNLYFHLETQAYSFFPNDTAGMNKALSYLWLNPIGAFSVVFWGTVLSLILPGKQGGK